MNGINRFWLIFFCTFFITTPCYATAVTGAGLALAAAFFIGFLVFSIGGPILCWTYEIHSARQCNYMGVLFVECIFSAIAATKVSDFLIVVFIIGGIGALRRLMANWDKMNIPSQDKSKDDKLVFRIILIPPMTIVAMLFVGLLSKIFG